jgi:hypothetical protein
LRLAAALALVMRGRRAADMPASVRVQLDDLRARQIVDPDGDVYRASHIALYSSCQLPAPPIRALAGEAETPAGEQTGRTAGIKPDLR